MKKYTGKTLEEVLTKASEELLVDKESIKYEILEEKKGLFTKKIEIAVYEISDVIDFSKQYLQDIITDLGLEVEFKERYEEGIIHLTINSSHNSILIGRNGRSLQSLNELVRNAIYHHFKERYRILLDINEYKDEKYAKLIRIAKSVAKEVKRTKVAATLDPMTSDERRVIHNALSNFKNIKTESNGKGHHRQITIYYVED
ncbi:MAG: RNA-binding cell elongation regulator Jag/EloR [Bacilli bacterium]|nr:RNA-binding cell elongation regulator Jag/EloR [Bacilli bacterium]